MKSRDGLGPLLVVVLFAAAGTTVVTFWDHTGALVVGALFALAQAGILVVYVYNHRHPPGAASQPASPSQGIRSRTAVQDARIEATPEGRPHLSRDAVRSRRRLRRTESLLLMVFGISVTLSAVAVADEPVFAIPAALFAMGLFIASAILYLASRREDG